MAGNNKRSLTFDQLFKQISPEEICDHVSPLGGKDFPVITAGKEDHYNSMTGSGGGFGLLFKKPTTWCILRADRYTLEIMQKSAPIRCLTSPLPIRNKCSFLGANQEGLAGK